MLLQYPSEHVARTCVDVSLRIHGVDVPDYTVEGEGVRWMEAQGTPVGLADRTLLLFIYLFLP